MHGWDGRGSQLGHFVEPLINAGFQVIAMDGPAHGDSPGVRTNLVDFAHKILASQDELGNFHAVIAHSFGGAATLLAANKGLQAEKLVLIASPYDLQAIFDRFATFMRLSPQAKQHFQSYIEKEAQLSVEELPMKKIISHLKTPVLLIHDKEDREIPYDDALRFKDNLQQVDFLSTEGLGHRYILKSEQVINRVLDFLTAIH
ncbi:alpha/beta hydrolase [Legionella tunisiensis]|uniref:alpha/beta hydrolase n=1 Tax=Legionella tunisiensis TaxID=1034944 RepID=UPI00030CC655|nr:alpha/beta hydrolase [Legionella tunisiensis]